MPTRPSSLSVDQLVKSSQNHFYLTLPFRLMKKKQSIKEERPVVVNDETTVVSPLLGPNKPDELNHLDPSNPLMSDTHGINRQPKHPHPVALTVISWGMKVLFLLYSLHYVILSVSFHWYGRRQVEVVHTVYLLGIISFTLAVILAIILIVKADENRTRSTSSIVLTSLITIDLIRYGDIVHMGYQVIGEVVAGTLAVMFIMKSNIYQGRYQRILLGVGVAVWAAAPLILVAAKFLNSNYGPGLYTPLVLYLLSTALIVLAEMLSWSGMKRNDDSDSDNIHV